MKLAYCLAVLLVFVRPSLAQPRYVTNGDCAFPAGKHIFHYVWDSQPVQDAELDTPPERTDSAPVPATPRPLEIATSERAYTDGRYAEAAGAVVMLARQEPADPDVLNCYARALYHQPDTRAQSWPVYQQLIALLDRYGRENPQVASVYGVYFEAYFKLATLQLDHQQWATASYNLSRAAGALQALPSVAVGNQPLREQILQYQTECFAHLNQLALCRYFGQRTLRFFPQNQYVLPYLAALPKAKPAGHSQR